MPSWGSTKGAMTGSSSINRLKALTIGVPSSEAATIDWSRRFDEDRGTSRHVLPWMHAGSRCGETEGLTSGAPMPGIHGVGLVLAEVQAVLGSLDMRFGVASLPALFGVAPFETGTSPAPSSADGGVGASPSPNAMVVGPKRPSLMACCSSSDFHLARSERNSFCTSSISWYRISAESAEYLCASVHVPASSSKLPPDLDAPMSPRCRCWVPSQPKTSRYRTERKFFGSTDPLSCFSMPMAPRTHKSHNPWEAYATGNK
mmetsp:Transcript_12037/g.32959  ORF Transcript_12037/g.32959 Transcript_12037/m.32959 type:complete len:259 (+) Transcript_12037:1652-2428(+)